MHGNTLTERALTIIYHWGKDGVNQTCHRILDFDYGDEVIGNVLRYYSQTTLSRVLPIFPSLIYLSYNTIAKPEKIDQIVSAMMLITASGDIHDDIIDNSTQKLGKQTVFGKYGKNAAILAGDALLIQGITLLNSCEELTTRQKDRITGLITQSMLEMIRAESLETDLWSRQSVTPQEFFEVIRLKGSAAELHCKIGGILGNGDEAALKNLAQYGRLIGVLATMKEEFSDVGYTVEFKHRIKHEMPPYPVIFALQDRKIEEQITPILKKKPLLSRDLQFVAKTVLESKKIMKLKSEMTALGQKELNENPVLRNNKKAEELATILRALAFEI